MLPRTSPNQEQCQLWSAVPPCESEGQAGLETSKRVVSPTLCGYPGGLFLFCFVSFVEGLCIVLLFKLPRWENFLFSFYSWQNLGPPESQITYRTSEQQSCEGLLFPSRDLQKKEQNMRSDSSTIFQ